LRALNARHPIVPGDKSDKARTALVEYISHRYQGKFYPISRSQAKQFYSSYAEQNEQLRKLAFPMYSSPLFEEDFSEYPEKAEHLDLGQNDVVDLVLDMWREKISFPINSPTLGSKINSWLSKMRGR